MVKPWKDELAVAVLDARIKRFLAASICGCVRQSAASSFLQRRTWGSKLALRRIADDTVLCAVERVAGGQRSALHGSQFSIGNIRFGIVHQDLHDARAVGQQRGPGVGWRPGENAAVVAGKPLGFH
jgi:hypothetical protein